MDLLSIDSLTDGQIASILDSADSFLAANRSGRRDDRLRRLDGGGRGGRARPRELDGDRLAALPGGTDPQPAAALRGEPVGTLVS